MNSLTLFNFIFFNTCINLFYFLILLLNVKLICYSSFKRFLNPGSYICNLYNFSFFWFLLCDMKSKKKKKMSFRYRFTTSSHNHWVASKNVTRKDSSPGIRWKVVRVASSRFLLNEQNHLRGLSQYLLEAANFWESSLPRFLK